MPKPKHSDSTGQEYRNQYYPWSNTYLNPDEGRIVVQCLVDILDDAHSADPKLRSSAAVMVLGITLGRNHPDTFRLRLFDSATDSGLRPDETLALDLVRGIARWSMDPPADAAKHQPHYQSFVEDVASHIDVALPGFAFHRLKNLRRRVGNFTSVGAVLDLTFAEFKYYRERINRRLTRAGVINELGDRKLANILWSAMYRTSGNFVLAEQMAGLATRDLSADYYLTYQTKQVQESYAQAIVEIHPSESAFSHARATVSNAKFVGNPIYPTARAIRTLITRLRDEAIDALARRQSDTDLIEAHNAFMRHVLVLLLYFSAGRIVRDPFPRMAGFVEPLSAVILSDKTRDAQDGGSLSFLPDLVFDQLRHYRDHLYGLADRLIYVDKPLAQTIKSLVERRFDAAPLLFHLQASKPEAGHGSGIEIGTITQKYITDLFAEIWPLPANALRHCLASDLLAAGAPVDLVLYQLRHAPVGQDPYGRFSMLAPEDVQHQLSPYLQALTGRHPWQAIKGFPRYTRQGTRADLEISSPLPAMEFGAKARAAKRALVNDRFVQIARDVLAEIDPGWSTRDSLERADLLRSAEQIVNEQFSKERSKGKRIEEKLFSLVQSPARSSVGTRASVFIEDDQIAIELGRWLHEHLASALTTVLEHNPVDLLTALAAAWLVAAIYDGIVDRRCYARFAESLLEPLALESDWVRIELQAKARTVDDDDAPTVVRAWFSSPVSVGFVLQAAQLKPAESAEVPAFSQIRTKAMHLLRDVLEDEDLYSHLAKSGITALGRLFQTAAETLQFVRLPAAVADYARGLNTSTGLPRRAWERLASRRVGSQEPPRAPRQGADADAAPSTEPTHPPRRRHRKNIRISVLKTTIAHHQKLSESDVGMSATLGVRRARLAEAIDSLIDHTREPESLSDLLALWSHHQASGKTMYGNVIEPKTIRHYVTTVANALPGGIPDYQQNFPNGLADVYKNAITAQPKKKRAKVAQVFYYFHEYLVDERDVEPVDFSDIAEECAVRIRGVRANIVTPLEYREILRRFDGESESAYNALAGKSFTILMYRSGGRLSEVLGDCIRDLQPDAPVPKLCILGNDYRGLKTGFSRRTVPLLLTREEEEILREFLILRKRRPCAAPTDLLFTTGQFPNKPDLADTLSGTLRNLARAVSGDRTVNLHTFRHTHATYLVLYATYTGNDRDKLWQYDEWAAGTPAEEKSFCEFFLGQNRTLRASLYWISQWLGHASPETTLIYYVHCLDWLQARLANTGLPRLTDRQIGALFGLRPSDVPQYRKRQHDQRGEYSGIARWSVRTRRNRA